MAKKALTRLRARARGGERAATREWCTARAEDVAAYAGGRDSSLWAEAVAFAQHHEQRARPILDALGVPLGGAAHVGLLHFLVRLRRPRTILETGVAAGFSSQAMLAALARNGDGTLYSSDLPYLRLDQPERYVGAVVDAALKDRWQLFLKGDRRNLAPILRACGQIDLVHYDSDKSYAGRAHVMERIRARLAADATVVMDDIENNAFFQDLVEATGLPARVFRHQDKFIGIIDRMEADGQ